MAGNKSQSQILGFQFEPRKKTKVRFPDDHDSDSSWETIDDLSDGEGEFSAGKVCEPNVDSWCSCGKCVPMLTEKECCCCHKLDVSELFGLKAGSY